ncbi:hypothetical protein BX600DRAFT_490824 [Xylariales sp. PMI_506]|nr:hypothetical protein BX600DRAFT_490824 [Xylariales sp. PMI_506]
MRLLERDDKGRYSLTPDFPPGDVPSYAILSHTWGLDEVVYSDLAKSESEWQHKAGFEKIRFCAEQASRDGLQYFWVDTCCIDKTDSIELQIAINSMFRWYREAKRCYVYLSDVSSTSISGMQQSAIPWEVDLRKSRWFTRGWTLQELVAPKTVEFYSKEGVWLGNKETLEHVIRDVTHIPSRALRGDDLSTFSISERETWICNRHTKYGEDMAYSLSGIFGVYLVPIYGEGRENAQRRLQEEIQKKLKGTRINDFSVTFSLSEVPETQDFVARERELAEIRRTLVSDGSRRVVVLHGLGGIGKTQLAVTYTKRYRDEYSAIFWLNIKDEASIQQSFTKIAKQILHQHPSADRLSALDLQQNSDEVVEGVKAWLSLPENTRWLLVYDNYDNPKLADRTDHAGIDIQRFLPTAYQGSVIITTRSLQINLGHSIRIRKLESKVDCLKILSTTSGRANLEHDIDAANLVKELDGLPLALATAGAYLRRVAIGFNDYLRLYKDSWATLHTNTPSLGSYQDRTLCSTWQLSYEQVQRQNPLAANLLRWLAYFDNEDIWFELLQHPYEGVDIDDSKLPMHHAWIDELTDELKFSSAMGTLHDYGFVEPNVSTSDLIGSRGYNIHSCIHSWTIHVVNKDWDHSLAKLAVECVAAHIPSENETQFWLLQRRLLPHAIRSCTAIRDSDQGLAWAFHNLGILYEGQGVLYRSQNKLQEAEEMYLRALRGYEKVWGPDHTSTLNTVNNLGDLYRHQGKLQEAEELYLRAFRGKEKAYGPDHTSTLDTVNNLGILYTYQSKLQEAEEMYLRALRGKEKAWGPDHTSTLDTVNNLGMLYRHQGKLQEAEEMYLRALKGKEKAWGPDHTSTLDTVNNLGEAEEMYLRALRGYEKAYEPDHTSTLSAVNNLGMLYIHQGKLQEAEEMYLRAFRGYEKACGPDHTSTLDTVNNLGEAEEMCLRALRGYEKAYGPDHTSTLDTVNNLGTLYADQGKSQQAEEMCLRALRGYRPAINSTWGLGTSLRKQGKLAEARRYYQPLLGPSHGDVQTLENLLLDLDETEQCEEI